MQTSQIIDCSFVYLSMLYFSSCGMVKYNPVQHKEMKEGLHLDGSRAPAIQLQRGTMQ
jgi:hypothetical protein